MTASWFFDILLYIVPPPPFHKDDHSPFGPPPSDIPIMMPPPNTNQLLWKKPHFKDKWRYLKTVLVTYKQKIITTQKKYYCYEKKKFAFCFLRTFILRPPVILLILLTKKSCLFLLLWILFSRKIMCHLCFAQSDDGQKNMNSTIDWALFRKKFRQIIWYDNFFKIALSLFYYKLPLG